MLQENVSDMPSTSISGADGSQALVQIPEDEVCLLYVPECMCVCVLSSCSIQKNIEKRMVSLQTTVTLRSV